ncbi:hypothetical protein BDZ91DRAFT_796492 [Kalaharituber pfeilii]|nr:hypothetical protein BDZ91DRAFT_796492 [Kalaharituber pfeilii]
MPDAPIKEDRQMGPERELEDNTPPSNAPKGPKNMFYTRAAARTQGGKTVDLHNKQPAREVTPTVTAWRGRDLWQAQLHGAPNWQEGCTDLRAANKTLEEFREKANRHLGKDAPYQIRRIILNREFLLRLRQDLPP